MPRLYFETSDPEPAPHEFGGDTDVLVYFLSFAFATRYGSQHPFSQFALMVRTLHKINMAPITTFADRAVEDEEDARELERVWQDAKPLADTLGKLLEVLRGPDETLKALAADPPGLLPRLEDLHRMATWAAERGARVRLSFEL